MQVGRYLFIIYYCLDRPLSNYSRGVQNLVNPGTTNTHACDKMEAAGTSVSLSGFMANFPFFYCHGLVDIVHVRRYLTNCWICANRILSEAYLGLPNMSKHQLFYMYNVLTISKYFFPLLKIEIVQSFCHRKKGQYRKIIVRRIFLEFEFIMGV